MFHRKIIKELNNWYHSDHRKPLVLRGARQVGKTTVVKEFGKRFDQFLYLNLELPDHRRPFEEFVNIRTLLQRLFFQENQYVSEPGSTLIFIDEIQAYPEAMQLLRYFYEETPQMAVIAAGSMLESLFNPDISFPVGRVEYRVIQPVSFPEFLGALGERTALDQLTQIPMADFAAEKLMQLFRIYCLTGGMPEVVARYSEQRDLTALGKVFDSLLMSYIEDVEKYADSSAQANYIRHAMRASFAEAGKRIKFEGFGNSNYKSREMGEALRALEKALLIRLIFPQTGARLPMAPDLRKSPRLQVLDTGMLNYFAGIQKDILGTEDLHSVYQGTMIEHMVGQELLAIQHNALNSLNFWVRDKGSSQAEVDYLYSHDGKLVPVEVKSGATGHLRSLHLYMDLAPHDMAVRFYSGEVKITQAKTPAGKSYRLLNLPYFLASQLEGYLNWAF